MLECKHSAEVFTRKMKTTLNLRGQKRTIGRINANAGTINANAKTITILTSNIITYKVWTKNFRTLSQRFWTSLIFPQN